MIKIGASAKIEEVPNSNKKDNKENINACKTIIFLKNIILLFNSVKQIVPIKNQYASK